MPDVKPSQRASQETLVHPEDTRMTGRPDPKGTKGSGGADRRAKKTTKKQKNPKEKKARKKKGPNLLTRALRGLAGMISRGWQAIRQNARPSSVILVVAFILLLGLLFLRSTTYSLNQQVYELEQELTQVQGEIDSKEGQLISSADIKEVEEKARALGMTEAKPGQYIYESYSQKNISNGELPGFTDYLSMFKEIRENMLWP